MIFYSVLHRPFFKLACALGLLIAGTGSASASESDIRLETKLGQPVLVADKTQRVYLKVALEGVMPVSTRKRTPVNIALVLDRSGSMRGKKMAQAKEAAIMAVNRLKADDVVSVIAYNHSVKTPLPANWLNNKKRARALISGMEADGKTALYAGVKEGLSEVGKFLSPTRVNRVILLSDGLANVGPSTPAELAELGRKAGSDGISVTTIGLGLGYNEDLMTQLAGSSDGNHAFVEKPEDLVAIFDKEFGDVLSVVAQKVEIIIRCETGFRPLRVLGRTAILDGQTVRMNLNQIYGGQQKYALLELEVTADKAQPGAADIADISVVYTNMGNQTRETLSGNVGARFSPSVSESRASTDNEVMADVTTQIAMANSERAVRLRDKGDIKGARNLLEENASYLSSAARKFSAPALEALGMEAAKSAGRLSESDWNRNRKILRARQYKQKTQQAY